LLYVAEVRSTPATGFRPIAWAGYPRDIETIGYEAGTLRIDLVDVGRSSSVWQGVAEGRIPDEALRNPGPTVDEAVWSIFRQFPDKTRL